MKRMTLKEFSSFLGSMGFKRKRITKNEEYDYTFHSKSLDCTILTSDCGDITLEGSDWLTYDDELAISILLGCKALNKKGKAVIEFWDRAVSDY